MHTADRQDILNAQKELAIRKNAQGDNTVAKALTIDLIFDKLLDENRDVLEHLKQ